MDKRISPQDKRAALLIRCSPAEAEMIRNAAKQERRPISGYVLNSVVRRIGFQKRTQEKLEQMRFRAGKARAARSSN
jgi:hypothetical protein